MSNHDKLNRQDPSSFRNRFVIVASIMFLVFILLGGRVWYLQILKGDDLRVRSENNRIRVQEIKPLRGLILDRRGETLVENHASFDIAIIPEETESVETVLSELRSLSGEQEISAEGSAAALASRRRFLPVTLERDVGWEKLALVETNSAMLPGIIIDVVPVRNYTMGPAMAHILGYVGEISSAELRMSGYRDYRRGSIIGKSGIERAMDHYLRGKSGGAQVEVNVAGQTLDVLTRVEALPGFNVVTTLDRDLQQISWDAFDRPAGVVIVMDSRDGSILAMVNKPSFDPNLFNRGIALRDWETFSKDALAPFKNRSLSALYPPASLFKLIVAAAALDQGLIAGNETVFCRGSIPVGDREFRCWRRQGHGALNLHQAIVQSCDVFFYTLGLQLGVDAIAEYSLRFGLGKVTGIDISGEGAGLVPSREWKQRRFGEPWHRGETASVSIGQGFLSSTPLQLVRAFAALANGGVLYEPRLIDRVESTKGDIIESFSPREQGQLSIVPEHMDILNKALWGVVNEPRGTGRALLRSERDVCGKTGTAQVVALPDDDDDRKDKKEIAYRFRDHALFACSVPCNDPRITVLVVVEHGGQGGAVAAPIARKIVDWYMENRVGGGSDEITAEESDQRAGEDI